MSGVAIPAELHRCTRCGSALPLKPLRVAADKWEASLRAGHEWALYECGCGSKARRQVRAPKGRP